MKEIIKLLDKNLSYQDHSLIEDTMYINVVSARDSVKCPCCNTPSSKVHSHYKKSFQDLPIQDKKVMIVLNNRKLFCVNEHCNKRTFAETFAFISSKSKKTTRLEREIIRISQHVSSLSAAKIINARVATIGKSTICNLLKKNNTTNP